MARRTVSTLVSLALIATLACRQIVGIHEEPPIALAPPDAGVDAPAGLCEPSSDVCHSCLAASCCAERTACDASPSCKRSFDCLVGCGELDEACRSACVSAVDASLSAVLACRAKSCGTECPSACGGLLGVDFPDVVTGAPGCAACAASKVCTEMSACAADPQCVQFSSCLQRTCAPYDHACATACKHPLGPSPTSDTLWSTLRGRCGAECRLGTNWDCVGKRSWPLGKPGEATFALRVLSATTQAPEAGDLVRVCFNSDAACTPATELGRATTDATGFASVTAPIAAPGLLAAYFEGTGGDLYPAISFIFPPLAGGLAGDAQYTPFTARLFSKTAVAFATASIGVSLVAGRGVVLASMADCHQVGASGVALDVSPSDGVATYYGAGAVLSTTATSTDESGTAIAINVTPGPVTLSVRIAATQQLVAQAAVLVRPDTMTVALLAPLPP